MHLIIFAMWLIITSIIKNKVLPKDWYYVYGFVIGFIGVWLLK